MAKAKSIHTVPTNTGWANKQGGKILSTDRLKEAAQSNGRKQAIQQKTEHVIHNKNGKISNANSYGNDPFPPKDKK